MFVIISVNSFVRLCHFQLHVAKIYMSYWLQFHKICHKHMNKVHVHDP